MVRLALGKHLALSHVNWLAIKKPGFDFAPTSGIVYIRYSSRRASP